MREEEKVGCEGISTSQGTERDNRVCAVHLGEAFKVTHFINLYLVSLFMFFTLEVDSFLQTDVSALLFRWKE